MRCDYFPQLATILLKSVHVKKEGAAAGGWVPSSTRHQPGPVSTGRWSRRPGRLHFPWSKQHCQHRLALTLDQQYSSNISTGQEKFSLSV